MEREALFLTITAALSGVVVWSFAAGTPAAAADPSAATRPGATSERRSWWRLVAPLFAGSLMFAFLVGWALQESDPADEWIGSGLLTLAGLTCVVAGRALWRGCVSLRATRHVHLPIATLGVLRCRTVVSEEFRRSAAPAALTAAMAHEAAHARGRDPLRIWLAQLAADLQWPVRGARCRLEDWLLALELRRDDDAIAGGANPVDLADAVLAAARLTAGGRSAAAAALGSAGVALRVRRLLRGADAMPPREAAGSREGGGLGGSGLCVALLVVATWLGLHYGDALLGILPGVRR